MKTALICGVSGQDGAYLSKLLLEKGYTVYGGSRDAQVSSFSNLERIGIKSKIFFVSININDFRSTLQCLLKIKPDEIYNLAGQSSVSLSFDQPVETLESISIGTLNLLEAIRFSQLNVKFYNAGSSECFGDIKDSKAHELTPFRPRSPYGVAKAAAYWQVSNYREAYNLYACTGILFNHESPLRPARFVTQKIISKAVQIAQGSKEKLYIGNIEIARDWGWAPDYVEAMWKMLQMPVAEDYVIATGQTSKLKDFIFLVFSSLDLNWEEYVIPDPGLFRPTDIAESHANPEKAFKQLEWRPSLSLKEIVKVMVNDKISKILI